MPEYAVENLARPPLEPNLYVPHKEIFAERSPRSPLSTLQSTDADSLDLAVDDIIAATSIDHLYRNVCELQSSDHSPSRRSFLSYGDESRIDYELHRLAGGDYSKDAIQREPVAPENASPITGEARSPKNLQPNASTVQGKNGLSPISNLRRNGSIGKPPKGTPTKGPRNGGGPGGGPRTPLSTKAKSPSCVGERSPRGLKEGYLGPYLLKQARDTMNGPGDGNLEKALELALRAANSFDTSPAPNPNLDLVMCLHVVATLHCRLGRHSEAIPFLQQSIRMLPDVDSGPDHALAKFSGCMQLGDAYAMLGRIESSIALYTEGLEIQHRALGDKDPRYADTCRYLAEAHIQALQFDEAEHLCLSALEIHKQHNGLSSGSPEEAADRRLLGLICESRGDYQTALEHYVLASMPMAADGRTADVAAIDCSIGDAYLSLARYDEAVFAYHKALNAFKSSMGEGHPSVAMVFVRLADLYNKIGKFSESKPCYENAIRIYSKPLNGVPPEEIASGLVDISAIYESMDEPEKAVELLQKAVDLYGDAPGQQGIIAGIEAQMGVLYYMLRNYSKSYESLRRAVQKFRATGEKKSAVFGIALNQMGLACVQILAINEAADLFEESRDVLEAECGPYHADTLGVYGNLAGTYDAMGRTGDAIEILEYIVELREERLGTANPDVDDEKRRLAELLKEAGLARRRKSRSLEALLNKHNITAPLDA